MFKSHEELVVKVSKPTIAHFRCPSLGDTLNDLSDLVKVLFPEILILEQVNVHEFNDHVNNGHMHLSQSSVFGDQFRCL